MKNITITVDDETYRQARIFAAEQNITVTALVRDYLTSLSLQKKDQHHEDVQKLLTVLEHVRSNSHYSAMNRLNRDDVYDRSNV